MFVMKPSCNTLPTRPLNNLLDVGSVVILDCRYVNGYGLWKGLFALDRVECGRFLDNVSCMRVSL